MVDEKDSNAWQQVVGARIHDSQIVCKFAFCENSTKFSR